MSDLLEILAPYWKKLTQIHNITKELYIRSEEYNDDLKSFIQPIKELKDAYEHIVRANTRAFINFSDVKDIDYIKSNMDKAIGHEFRAFFDTADFICIIFRKKINEKLEGFSYNQIVNEWPEYNFARKRIISIPEDIASIRIKKDIGSSEKMSSLVLDYKEIVEELINYYKKIDLEVYPQLATLYK